MRSSSTNSRARKAACVCSILFAGQALWLAALIAVKWGGGEFTKPSRFLDLQTDVLFLVSIVLSVVATAVNDWGWHNLSEFWKRLPATGTLVLVLALAIGAKCHATEDGSSSASLVPWIDMIEATIWLLLLGGGVRIWHRRNGGRKLPLSAAMRWIILVKLVALCGLWGFQAVRLTSGQGLPIWGTCLSDLLYLMGMLASWVSYMERRGFRLWVEALGLRTSDLGSNRVFVVHDPHGLNELHPRHEDRNHKGEGTSGDLHP